MCVRGALFSPVSHRPRWNTEKEREWRITNGKREIAGAASMAVEEEGLRVFQSVKIKI
ncbi:hypothetical protein M9458_002456, partial [Cirrhinus mrigala]